MRYELAIGDRTHSSWSLRSWLMFDHFDLPVKTRLIRLYSPDFIEKLTDFAPARTVPALSVDGTIIWDTLAIAETLAERHPELALWPRDAAQRALARAITAEMHSGFSAIRQACPMNLRHAYGGFAPDQAVLGNLARIEVLWSLARKSAGDGPWLFGAYSIADAFFAPVAMRIATYGLPVEVEARAYVQSHLNDPSLRRWRAMGLAENFHQPSYDFDLPVEPWPGPAPLPAAAVTDVEPINTICPYSGKPVSPEALAQIDGHVIGFCNQFCRDKSVADAAVWPLLLPLLKS